MYYMYQLGKVYKIINTQGDEVYIGSTFNLISQRMREHKLCFKKWLNGKNKKVIIYPYFKKNGIEKYKIVLIKEYICYREHNKDFKHLHAYEQLWINKLKCINNNCSFQPIKKERNKQYRKKYRKNNKEKIKEQTKEYRENNKEKLKEQAKVKINCVCGSTMRKDSKYKHERTKKHINFINSQ